ncbi:MAG: flavin reductase family protein [Syntrophomonadaceae bacterium]|nr:flavin reductase family protein [Syntrophomonadaceae bacterium]
MPTKTYTILASEMLQQLPKGAFLTVKDDKDRINTMTIGWGSIGYMWQKPIIMVAVRYSRYTYDLIENAPDFTVSFPYTNEMKKELAVAGTKSGRDIDKFKELSLTLQDSLETQSPAIAGCNLIFECKMIFKQPMEAKFLDEEIKRKHYSNNDYHVLYFGEIVACYSNEK